MEKSLNYWAWIEEGYALFAKEGPGALQVERLARILKLNKSSFYHYFGDQEGFWERLVKVHQRKADDYMAGLLTIKTFNPGYLKYLTQHQLFVLFQMQLTRSPRADIHQVAFTIDKRESRALRDMWAEFIGVSDYPELAERYFTIVRDVLYSRTSFENYHMHFLQSLFGEVKLVVQDIMQLKLTGVTL